MFDLLEDRSESSDCIENISDVNDLIQEEKLLSVAPIKSPDLLPSSVLRSETVRLSSFVASLLPVRALPINYMADFDSLSHVSFGMST